MSSLRELIYSQATASSQGSVFYTPKPAPQPKREVDPRPPEKIVGAVVEAVPCTRRNAKLGRQYPLYWNGPALKVERKRARASDPQSEVHAPGLQGFYMFPQLNQRYIEAYREVVRQLWDICALSGGSKTSLLVLKALCKLDALEKDDLSKAIYTVKEAAGEAAMRHLAEGLYKLAKAPLRNTNKDEVLRILVDYYTLVEKDYAIAQDLVESNPSFAPVSITLLCLKCVELAAIIASSDCETGRGALSADFSVEDVLVNPSSFAKIVSMLKKCLLSPDYGVVNQINYEDDGYSDSDFSYDSDIHSGRKRKRASQPVQRSQETPLPAKREISSLLTTLGTALRSFMGRRAGRGARAESDMSFDQGSVSTSLSSEWPSGSPLKEGLAGASEGADMIAGYSLDLHVMYACYLYGSGDAKEGLNEMRQMVALNSHVPRAHAAYVKYICSVYNQQRKLEIADAVEQWAKHDPSNVGAIVMNLLMFKQRLRLECMPHADVPDERNLSFTFGSKHRRIVDILCNFIDLMPPVQRVYPDDIRASKCILRSDFKFPFCASRNCAKCRGTHSRELPRPPPAASISLITAWTAWRALACILGPVGVDKVQSHPESKIGLSRTSEYYRVLERYRLTGSHAKGYLLQHNIRLPTEKSPDVLPRQRPISRHFESSRRWWKKSILPQYSVPFEGVISEGVLSFMEHKVLWSKGQENNYSFSNSLDWLDIIGSENQNDRESNPEGDLADVLRIGSSSRANQCNCDSAAVVIDCSTNNDTSIVGHFNRSFTLLDEYGNISCDGLIAEILCFQIVASCHLHRGCQDNIFTIRAIHFLLRKHGSSAGLTSDSDSLGNILRYFYSMKIDTFRAARLSNILTTKKICLDNLSSVISDEKV